MSLKTAIEYYTTQDPRGEYVLIVEGASAPTVPAISESDALARVFALQEAGASLKEAARQAAAETGFPKNRLYELALQSKQS